MRILNFSARYGALGQKGGDRRSDRLCVQANWLEIEMQRHLHLARAADGVGHDAES